MKVLKRPSGKMIHWPILKSQITCFVLKVPLHTNGTHRIALDILQDHYGDLPLTVIYRMNNLLNIENVS